jgi:hypothetical protein
VKGGVQEQRGIRHKTEKGTKPVTQPHPVAKKMLWVGRIISGLPAVPAHGRRHEVGEAGTSREDNRSGCIS